MMTPLSVARCQSLPYRRLPWLLVTPMFVRLGVSPALFASSFASSISSSVCFTSLPLRFRSRSSLLSFSFLSAIFLLFFLRFVVSFGYSYLSLFSLFLSFLIFFGNWVSVFGCFFV